MFPNLLQSVRAAALITVLVAGISPVPSYGQSAASADSASTSPGVSVTVTVPAEALNPAQPTPPLPAPPDNIDNRRWNDRGSAARSSTLDSRSSSFPILQALWRSEDHESNTDHAPAPEENDLIDEDWYGALENLSGFLGLDGSKGPEDLGINANFGFRGHLNWGYPVFEQLGLGVQLGTAINYSETAVRVIRSIDGVRDRFQSFTTLGLFQRTDFGVSWGFVHDWLSERYYQGIDVGQWRAQFGYALCCSDELGVWGAWRDRSDRATTGGETFDLRPIAQANLFWKHIWGNDTVTRMWIGLADSHGRFVFVAPGNTPIHHPFVFGADLYVPLTEHLSIWGEANFITPNDTGTVTATLGFAFFPGGAHHAVRSRFAPLLPVANNPTFALDLRQ